MPFVLLLLSIVPRDDTVRAECELVELNRCWGFIEQLIFWERAPDGSLRIRDTRFWPSSAMMPRADRGGWRSIWSEEGRLIDVRAPVYIETWTGDVNPDWEDCEFHPWEERRFFLPWW